MRVSRRWTSPTGIVVAGSPCPPRSWRGGSGPRRLRWRPIHRSAATVAGPQAAWRRAGPAGTGDVSRPTRSGRGCPDPRIGPDDRLVSGGLGQRDRAVGQLGADRDHLLADPRQPEIRDLEGTFLGHQQVARLDVAVAVQPLAQGVLQTDAELIAEPERPRQVEPGRPDPSVQIAALHQLEDHVGPAVEDLDRVRPHDVRMLAELGPDPALRGKPADPDAALQEFTAQGLEGDHFAPGFPEVVVDHVDEAHPAFMDVEHLESVADPVSDRYGRWHEGSPLPRSSTTPRPACPARPADPQTFLNIRGRLAFGSVSLKFIGVLPELLGPRRGKAARDRWESQSDPAGRRARGDGSGRPARSGGSSLDGMRYPSGGWYRPGGFSRAGSSPGTAPGPEVGTRLDRPDDGHQRLGVNQLLERDVVEV